MLWFFTLTNQLCLVGLGYKRPISCTQTYYPLEAQKIGYVLFPPYALLVKVTYSLQVIFNFVTNSKCYVTGYCWTSYDREYKIQYNFLFYFIFSFFPLHFGLLIISVVIYLNQYILNKIRTQNVFQVGVPS